MYRIFRRWLGSHLFSRHIARFMSSVLNRREVNIVCPLERPMKNAIVEATFNGRQNETCIFRTLLTPALFVVAGRNDDNFGQKRISLDDVFGLIKYGSPGIAEKFIKNNPEVAGVRHSMGWTPLMLAVILHKKDVVKCLLSAGAAIDAVDEYPGSYQVSMKSRKNPVEAEWCRLTEFSDYLNPHADFRGCTALHYAVLVDDKELVKILLAAGRNLLL
uniref:Uncharacterized protein n=1 Tax=Schistocephalus solidus TaxID=70667 RepID=A0A0X3NL63_SCHSO